MPLPLDTAALHTLVFSGEPVIFPGQHAARLWRARLFNGSPRPQQITGPVSWRDWLTSLWSNCLLEGGDDRPLLNHLQEEQVWVEVITTTAPPEVPSSALRDLASLAHSALHMAATHRLPRRLSPLADTVDARAFAQWLEQFTFRLDRDRLLAPALLEEAIALHIRNGAISVPDHLHLVGFDQLSPAQEHLLAAIRSAGSTVSEYSLLMPDAGAQPRRQTLEVADNREQLRTAVSLLAQEAASTPSDTSQLRLALVCPDPESHRQDLERLFREHLAPELEPVFADLSSTPWQFGLSQPLASLPVVVDALDLLRWTTEALSLERIRHLLITPSFAFADSIDARARFNSAALGSSALRGSLDLAGCARLMARLNPKAPSPNLQGERASFAELQAIAGVLTDVHLRRTPAFWSGRVREVLQMAGWPGTEAINPSLFQAMQAWDGVLDLLATLGFNNSPVTFHAFVMVLAAEAGKAGTSSVVADVPLQVLTPAQAEGLTFDLALLLDATEANIPAPENRHPLLPQSLQAGLGLGDPANQLLKARHTLNSFAGRSGRLILLAPLEGSTGEDQGLTPLAAQLGFIPFTPDIPLTRQYDAAAILTEAIRDPDLIPLDTLQVVRGGSDILSLQAACGFRAFATYRLHTREESPTQIGLAAREAGTLLHTALQYIWQRLGSQGALKVLPSEARDTLIRDAASEAMQKQRLTAPASDLWSQHFLGVLRKRFVRLLHRWLDLELERQPFTIHALEEQQTLAVGPLRLNLRTDRIDAVEGGHIFVDYKSSASLSSKQWLGERPDAPQLPAYALGADPDTLKDIAFARVRPGTSMGWISLTGAAEDVSRRKKAIDLPAQLAVWHEELTRLAQAFAEGRAEVNPKSYPQTCQFCAHRLLCRLDPVHLLEQEQEDDLMEEDALG